MLETKQKLFENDKLGTAVWYGIFRGFKNCIFFQHEESVNFYLFLRDSAHFNGREKILSRITAISSHIA